MKKHVHTLIKFVFVIVIFLGFKAAYAQNDLDLLWEITYGKTYPEIGTSVCQTYECEFAILGYTNPDNPRGFDIELVLLDTNGNVKWNEVYGGNKNDWGWSVKQTLDGGFIIGGTTTSYGEGPSDGYLIKTSPAGAMQWQKTFGGIGEEEIYSVQQTADGGFEGAVCCPHKCTHAQLDYAGYRTTGRGRYTAVLSGCGECRSGKRF